MEDETAPAPESEDLEVVETDEIIEMEEREQMDIRVLPIRAKPLFHNRQEDVEEFPLSETKDGLVSTSIVVGDGVFRVVTTTMHGDGVPRVDVQLVMDAEVTSFQHSIEKPAKVEIGISAGFLFIGICFMMVQGLSYMVLGLSMFFVGLKFLPTKFETHRLIFSSCGNSHEIELDAFGSFLPGFRASMALVGPAMADYIKTGHLDATDIDALHTELHAPVITQPILQPISQMPMLPASNPVQMPVEISEHPEGPVATTEQTVENEQLPVHEEPQSSGPPTISVVPDEPVPSSLPSAPIPKMAPPAVIPPPPAINPPSPMTPPAPLAPPQAMASPTPLPPPLAPMPAPPTGLNQPIPLDMPMPEAPRIAVQATPNSAPTISQEEQDALLDELA